jgi:soluble lytic murein transglycosylase-like protein
MAELNLNIPAAPLKSPSSWGSRASIKGMIAKIWKNYGFYIKVASENSNIPSSVIASFIAVESGGNQNAGSAGHITQGLMQWNRNYAQAQLKDELAKGRMSEGEKIILKKYGVMSKDGSIRPITNKDQLQPELNITIGSIVLGQLIDQKWGSSNGKLYLDRVIAVYNAGAYGDTGKKARQITSPTFSTPQTLAANVNKITSSYISKMMGADGALDIATSDLKNIIV